MPKLSILWHWSSCIIPCTTSCTIARIRISAISSRHLGSFLPKLSILCLSYIVQDASIFLCSKIVLNFILYSLHNLIDFIYLFFVPFPLFSHTLSTSLSISLLLLTRYTLCFFSISNIFFYYVFHLFNFFAWKATVCFKNKSFKSKLWLKTILKLNKKISAKWRFHWSQINVSTTKILMEYTQNAQSDACDFVFLTKRSSDWFSINFELKIWLPYNHLSLADSFSIW